MKTWSQDLAKSWYTKDTEAPCGAMSTNGNDELMAHLGDNGEFESPRVLVVRISDIIRVFVAVPSPGG